MVSALLGFIKLPAVLAAGSVISVISKSVTDRIIALKIEELFLQAKGRIYKLYQNYYKSVFISAALNLMIICVSLVPVFLRRVNNAVILSVSLLTLCIVIRVCVKTLLHIRILAVNWSGIKPRLGKFFRLIKTNSWENTVRKMIRAEYRNVYDTKVNDFFRIVHYLGARLNLVKSKENIEDDVVEAFYHLIVSYVKRLVVYRIIAIAAFYSIFIFLLKPYIFSLALKMSLADILLFPFAYTIPALVKALRALL
jgi:hypothetical protein